MARHANSHRWSLTGTAPNRGVWTCRRCGLEVLAPETPQYKPGEVWGGRLVTKRTAGLRPACGG